MTNTYKDPAGRRLRRRGALLAGVAALIVAAACSDSNVPFLTAPTNVPNTPTGLQQALLGLFSNSRSDMFQVGIQLSAMSREATNFTSTEPRFIRYDTGVLPTPVGGWIEMWQTEYQNVRTAQLILQAIPKVQPAYTAQQTAGLNGLVKTIEAYNYLLIAWAHDTEGFVIMTSPTTTTLNPLYCLKDGLAAIAALLDSANADLNTAGSTPFPFKLPPGFAAVGQSAGPSTVAGSFAAFNRALAARTKLELAYAMAPTQPTFTSLGTPNQAMLTSADSAMKASALFQPTSLPKNTAGGWPYDNFSVLWDFSTASGDQVNPMNQNVGTLAVMNQVVYDQDTAADLRWKAKFVLNPACNAGCTNWPVQLPGYSEASAPNSPPVASKNIYAMYLAPGAPLPIIRSENMTLFEAEIRLGLGDIPGAVGYINDVRTEVGGLAPVNPVAPTDVRNQIMKEQEISTLMEGGADRLVSIQMYNVALQADTTWEHVPGYMSDAHTSMFVLTSEEFVSRGNKWNPSCP
jgi:starch-binding outer membrane protein, SusD/RagB family